MDNLDRGDSITQPEGEVQGSVEVPHVEIPGHAMVDFEKRYTETHCSVGHLLCQRTCPRGRGWQRWRSQAAEAGPQPLM